MTLAGLLELLPMVLSWVPGADAAQSIFVSGPAQAIRVVALLAACVLLAFGFRRETGIVGGSLAGRIALLVVGLAFPIQSLAGFALFSGGIAGTWPGLLLSMLLQFVPIAALGIAAVIVVRARLLDGVARWALLAVAVAQVLLFALAAVPNASQDYSFAVLIYGAALPSLLLVAAGASLALSGRSRVVATSVS